jgi:agmatine deiminase
VYTEIVRHLAAGERANARQFHQSQGGGNQVLKRAGVDLPSVHFCLTHQPRLDATSARSSFAAALPGDRAIPFQCLGEISDWKRRSDPGTRREAIQAAVDRWQDRLEGGSIDVNGRGTLITTEECLLDQDPDSESRGRVSKCVSRRWASRTRCGWAKESRATTRTGMDDLCRFVKPGTVVLCREDNPKDVITNRSPRIASG